MNAQDRLRQAIAEDHDRLRATVPADRAAAILALLRAQDRVPIQSIIEPTTDLVTGRRVSNLGGNKALQLCLSAAAAAAAAVADEVVSDVWADSFLEKCRRLAEAELVLTHTETGFMRLVDDRNGTFDAWIATKRAPTAWQERADIDWWAGWLRKRHAPEFRALQSHRPEPGSGEPTTTAYYLRLADLHLQAMSYQLGYPPEAEIGGVTIQTYRDVLARLLAWALQAHNRGESPIPQPELELADRLASALGIDPLTATEAIAAFTVDRAGAAYHAAVPGVASAPLIRVDTDRLVWSLHGLTAEPLLFLTRDLRRRVPDEYNNTAHLREDVFRRELYALFPDKRFVTSPARIVLRRSDGDVRTDIDAIVFDRKTGTLGLFELKSHDPFARSTAELTRQRDNVLYANRQIAGVLAWLKQHGPDELVNRFDSRTAKTFRANKVFPFVLGRYLAHFNDGPEPDRRAAWATWPQLLRLLDGQPVRATDANPIASLFTRLSKDLPSIAPPPGALPREIALGTARVTVYPSYAAFQSSTPGDPT